MIVASCVSFLKIKETIAFKDRNKNDIHYYGSSTSKYGISFDENCSSDCSSKSCTLICS